ncbi:hypothetical protein Bca52824_001995 [Brassica carinata]|uniref:Ubiquitin-like domain-containing protein n=1 Tax=Brassica carinata TaxID=52824 RepID=A0A8X7WKC9_BRACI|nr:hypothetical protein Bca52824_001995 [Brassica carinata]
MLVFIDTAYGSTFCIELNLNDKVLDIKNKIEASQGIPVSMQTLYYNGEPLLVDDLDLSTCNIVTNSRVILVLSYQEDNNDQVLQPTSEQSLAPSTLGEFQDWTATARSIFREMLDQREQSLTRSAMMARHDKNQDLLQSEPSSTSNTFEEDLPLLQPTEQSLAPVQDSLGEFQDWAATASSIFREMLDQPEQSLARSAMARHDKNQDLLQSEPSSTSNTFGKDLPLPTELFSSIQSHWPASTTNEKGIDNSNVFYTEQSTIPSSEVEALDNQVWSAMMASTAEGNASFQESSGRHHTNQDSTSNTFGDLLFGDDLPLSTEHFSNIQSHWPASTTEDILVNKEQLFQTEQPLVPSNSTEQRSNEVVQTEKSPPMKEVINVPDSPVKVRRFRKPPQRLRNVLDDDQSFLWNGVAHGDTIEIFPGYFTKDGRTFGRFK